jgi:hypothetical protein
MANKLLIKQSWSIKVLMLTKKEVLSELKQLGINTVSELNSYFSEYKTYTLQNNSSSTLSEKYHTGIESNHVSQLSRSKYYK